MRLDMNPRGNGACPLCRRDSDCRLKKLLAESLAAQPDPQEQGLELVIYSCPAFAEKAHS